MSNVLSKLLPTLQPSIYHLHKAGNHFSHGCYSDEVIALYEYEVRMVGGSEAGTNWFYGPGFILKDSLRDENTALEVRGIDVKAMDEEQWLKVGTDVCLHLGRQEVEKALWALALEEKVGEAQG